MQYRREIDGLRAIAVLPVIFFHAGSKIFSGGYVGVDVFFVISGFLITSIILSEKDNGTYSIVRFYERRARRILPALFLVMLVSSFGAWLWLKPTDMKDFSQSLVATTLFSSNIHFLMESGYFGAANELKPLLHTWSLAVEEQYYLFFPLVLALAWRWGKRHVLVSIIVIAATSLIASQWGLYYNPSSAYFLLHSRAWELMIGALAAFYVLYRAPNYLVEKEHRLIKEFFSLLGLSLIAWSVFLFDKTTPFPGFNALLPTLGAVLVILFATPVNLVGRLLGSRILVGLGLVSYSAYLWHQPLFVFARHRSLREPSDLVFAVLTMVTLVLAYLSWRFVERPFRDRQVITRKRIFTLAVLGGSVFVFFGCLGHFDKGFGFRKTKDGISYRNLDRKVREIRGLSDKCDTVQGALSYCRTDDHPEMLVWGDSYAMHLVPGILSSNSSAKIIQMTKSSCFPDLQLAVFGGNVSRFEAEQCLEFNSQVFDWLKGNNEVKYVVISSPFDLLKRVKHTGISKQGVIEFDNKKILDSFEQTLDLILGLGKKPVVVSPPPRNGDDIGRCLVKANMYGYDLSECDFSTNEYLTSQQVIVKFLLEVQKKYSVIWIPDFLCKDGRCSASYGQVFFYRDRGHLSYDGSSFIGKEIGFYDRIKSVTPVITQK